MFTSDEVEVNEKKLGLRFGGETYGTVVSVDHFDRR